MTDATISDVVLSADDIRTGVAQVAARLNERYDSAVVITVVPGGILHTADLVRQLDFDVAMDYISCPHTPGARNNASPSSITPTSTSPAATSSWSTMRSSPAER